MSTTLQFTGRGAIAAESLYLHTSIGAAVVAITVSDPGFDLSLIVVDGITPSTGERVLLDLLFSFSTMQHRLPNVYAYGLLDEETRAVALTAVLIAADVVDPVVGRHVAADPMGECDAYAPIGGAA